MIDNFLTIPHANETDRKMIIFRSNLARSRITHLYDAARDLASAHPINRVPLKFINEETARIRVNRNYASLAKPVRARTTNSYNTVASIGNVIRRSRE
jgi:hypothetical protein